MKVATLIEYNMRIIFLEKPYTKCGELWRTKTEHILGSVV